MHYLFINILEIAGSAICALSSLIRLQRFDEISLHYLAIFARGGTKFGSASSPSGEGALPTLPRLKQLVFEKCA